MKLFLLLASLSKEELKVLRKAVLSPLYNSNKKVVQLFELLRPKHPTFDASQKAKENFFKKLFPAEAFHDYKWRRLCSELTKVIEEVMIHIDTMENDFARQKQLKQIYNKRGLYPLFQKHTSELLAQLEVEPIRNVEFHRKKMDLLTSRYFHHTHDKYDLEDETIENAMEELDTYFALQKLRLAIAFKGKQQVFKKNRPILFLKAIKEERQQGFQFDNTLLSLYFQAMDFSEDTSFKEFKKYEQGLFREIEEFDEFDQKILFRIGLNFAVKRKNSNQSFFKPVPFKWYKFGLPKNFLFEQDKLRETTFANILIAGCQEKQFEWVEDFIESYKAYLNKGNIEDTVLYYRGLTFYLKGDWNEALYYLQRSSEKADYPLRSRNVIIRCLFEQFLMDESYLELLLSNIQSFETYLRRDNFFVEEKKIPHLNFLQILRLLARKIHANESPIIIKDWFNKRLMNGVPILAKSWLLEKINKL